MSRGRHSRPRRTNLSVNAMHEAMLFRTVLLAAAGAAGAVLRVAGVAVAGRLLGDAFPWGTLAVNVAGSFACGAVHSFARSRGLAAGTEAVLVGGLLGGFTTYASFALQTNEMLAAGRVAAALVYVAATVVAGLAAVWAGLRTFG